MSNKASEASDEIQALKLMLRQVLDGPEMCETVSQSIIQVTLNQLEAVVQILERRED